MTQVSYALKLEMLLFFTFLTEKDPDEAKEEEEMRTAGESRRNYLKQLKEQRDYKRRRQSYRAKNVHITRRTPVQVGT